MEFSVEPTLNWTPDAWLCTFHLDGVLATLHSDSDTTLWGNPTSLHDKTRGCSQLGVFAMNEQFVIKVKDEPQKEKKDSVDTKPMKVM